ncbi:hypothetical protein BN1708_020506, partial [Verticillium longisporum]
LRQGGRHHRPDRPQGHPLVLQLAVQPRRRPPRRPPHQALVHHLGHPQGHRPRRRLGVHQGQDGPLLRRRRHRPLLRGPGRRQRHAAK